MLEKIKKFLRIAKIIMDVGKIVIEMVQKIIDYFTPSKDVCYA